MTQGTTARIGTPTIKGTLLYAIAKEELPEGFEKGLRQKIRSGKTKQAGREIAQIAGNYSKDALIFALFQACCATDALTPAAELLAEVAFAMGTYEN